MACSSSKLPPSEMAFDVFISFNRNNENDNYRRFRKELYENLCGWGMKVFMDDDGNTKKVFMDTYLYPRLIVSDKIVKAIEGSKTCIVFLSKEYAASELCLRELEKIHKTTTKVLPLFYHAEGYSYAPWGSMNSHVPYMEEINNIELKYNNFKEVQGWRVAMSQICSLSGVAVSPMTLSFPIRVMKSIFDKLLHLKVVAKTRYLLEMPLRLRTVKMLLGLGSNDDVRFIGIVGMGGIGKTTIAELLYDRFAHIFWDYCCFLYIDGHNNVVSLQQQLLSQLFFIKDDTKIMDENQGVELIKYYLSFHGKVLLILDGINKKSQLEMLAGSPDWFSSGSRVIITTRNKDILHETNFKDKVQEYNVKLLSDIGAYSLFCKHAFGECPPDENLKDLCDEIIEKVGKLPLALVKIASSLFGQGIDIWEETLKSFHKVFYENIFIDVLKTSYEGLEVETQQIFLDLACFLNGEKVDRIIEILEGFGYSSPRTKLQLLVDRCLIDISNDLIQMHILILCMGQELVRRDVGIHRRIWLREDARRLLHDNNELKYIQGIVMDLEEEEELELEAKSFAEMSELKILQINNVQLSKDIECLSNKLTLFNWPGYPSKNLPTNFQPPPLLELHLPGSNVERLWNGRKKFENLKEIDVSDSKYLVETPDFSEVQNLRRLILRNCDKLHEVHSSINSLERLVLLDMEGCVSFTRFSFAITCKRLKTFLLSNSGLESFPEFGCYMECLTELHIDGTFINQLSPSITYLTALVLLNLRNCIRLSSLNPTEIGSLSSLKTLILNDCKILDQIPQSLGNVKPLEELDIGGTFISTIPLLENLRILNCERLKSNIWLSLASLPTHYFRSLKDLNLSDCNLVDEDIPNDLDHFSSLEILDLSSNHFERLSERIEQLINLKALYLNDCHKLKQVTKLPASLRYVGGEKSLDMLRTSQVSPACTMSPSPSNAPLLANNDNFLNKADLEGYSSEEVDIVEDMGKQSDHKLLLSYKASLVGMENQVEKVCKLLDLKRLNDILFVGIFGSSGIGKTSIAEVVYNTIMDEFESSCFLYLSSKQNSLVPLQRQMFSQFLSEETKIWDEDHGAKLIKHHMSDKRVLIVLDGVYETSQIEKLAGSPDWFAPGSRVIITTTNRYVLDRLNYGDKVREYDVELLSHENAYSLFCKNAFGDGPFDKNELCNEIVEKVGRLPLALKTIGSYLHNKELDVWDATLKRLNEVEQHFFDTILQRSKKNFHPH